MLYPHSQEPFDPEIFLSPGPEYRAAPFWAWNDELPEWKLDEQIEAFRSMGMGGFHMHPRTGLDVPYLSDEFMDKIRHCVEKAKEEGLLAWLYDEDRWPSGFAGGLVTENPEYRARYLRFTVHRDPEHYTNRVQDGSSTPQAKPEGERILLGIYDIELDDAGDLLRYERTEDTEAAGEQGGSGQSVSPGMKRWYAWLETAAANSWYNNQGYVDTLNPEAIRAFIERTHERYKASVGEEFGKSVPAIFTDEPQFLRKSCLAFAHSEEDVILPWTGKLADFIQAETGADILAGLPELIWNRSGGEDSWLRWIYHDRLTELFARAFADQVGQWCSENGISLTGHLMEEPTLGSQTAAVGDAMRSYRSFQLPGIDMLCDHYEFTTAKQAQSAARQYGHEGVMSELYGVTGWHYDFRGYKVQGDWQAALGVTVRVPHLSWFSMRGEAKRDYPATIGYQAPWMEAWPLIEDHFARVNSVLTRGRARARIAVVHPVESFWLLWGPADRNGEAREVMETDFQNLIHWLLLNQIDFDYISESQLTELCPRGGSPLQVGEGRYEAVFVSGCRTLRSSTLERLEAFRDEGGGLVFLGEPPELEEARPSDRGRQLAARSLFLPLGKQAVLRAAEAWRDLELLRPDGRRSEDYIYQLREDGETRWLFVARGTNPAAACDRASVETLQIKIKGEWTVRVLDTGTGEARDQESYLLMDSHGKAATAFWHRFGLHDSLLLELNPREESETSDWSEELAAQGRRLARRPDRRLLYYWDTVPVTLEEPNVLLLDQGEWRLDDGEWQPVEEVLRADNLARQLLGWPEAGGRSAQPWTREKETAEHSFTMRWRFRSDDRYELTLGLEEAKTAHVVFNGLAIPTARCSEHRYYVDHAIQTVELGDAQPGENVLEITWPYVKHRTMEACYILGEFSVRVRGTQLDLGDPVQELAFGSIVYQGLPFYGGNLVYHLDVPVTAELKGRGRQTHRLVLSATLYRGDLMEVQVDDSELLPLIYAPYEVLLPAVNPKHPHLISIRVYGNRANTFGPLHNCDALETWFGPGIYRSRGAAWSYNCQFRDMGLLKSPELWLEKDG